MSQEDSSLFRGRSLCIDHWRDIAWLAMEVSKVVLTERWASSGSLKTVGRVGKAGRAGRAGMVLETEMSLGRMGTSGHLLS